MKTPPHASQIRTISLLRAVTRCCMLLLMSDLAMGQSRFRFRTLGAREGLSQAQVNCILQDQRGFIWVATKDGLNRFDGYRFKVYRFDPGDSQSISDNLVTTLMEDHLGQLWVGTSGGLNLYDRNEDSFTAQSMDAAVWRTGSETINALLEDKDGMIWIATERRGLLCFNPETQLLQRYEPNSTTPDPFPSANAKCLAQDEDGTLWVGTAHGLARFKPDTSSWHTYGQGDTQKDPQLLSAMRITSLLAFKQRLWIGTDGGLFQLDPRTGNFQKILHEKPSHDFPYDPVYVLKIIDGELWTSCNSGLFRIPGSQLNGPIKIADKLSGTNLDGTIIDLYQDRSGLIWFGTSGYGISIFNPRRPFEIFAFDPTHPDSLQHPYVYAVQRMRSGDLWIGTAAGVDVWNPRLGQMLHLDSAKDGTKQSYSVQALLETPRHGIWAATDSGLIKFDPKSPLDGPVKIFNTTNSDILNDNATCLFQRNLAQDPRIWVGTLDGFIAIDPSTEHIRQYKYAPNGAGPAHPIIRMFAETRSSAGPLLWIATEAGLDMLDLTSNRFVHFTANPRQPGSLSNDRLICLYSDVERDRLWIGTRGGGLNAFDLKTHRFRTWRMREGLPNDTVYGIVPGTKGRIWLSTNQGLARFDPATNQFATYTEADGLQGNEFNTNACARDESGILYFGGTEGLTYFNPNQISTNTKPPALAFTEFQIFNKPVETKSRQAKSPLSRCISETKAITLDYDNNVFSFGFTALDFADPSNQHYAYQMEGFDNGWLQTNSNLRTATYTNLNPGTYRFRVRACNNDGIWNEAGIAIDLTIEPPAWMTWWAYTLYVLMLISLVAAYGHYQKQLRRRLGRMVSERTRELDQKNQELDAGLREQETLLAVAKIINREVSLDRIIGTIMDQCLGSFPHANLAVYLEYLPREHVFRYLAVAGESQAAFKDFYLKEDLVKPYLSLTTPEREGILHLSVVPEGARRQLFTQAKSMLVMPLYIQGKLSGLMSLVNTEHIEAFDSPDLARLSRFREHMVTALMRARVVSDLVETQRALVEQAHQNGMAEIATQVLHNLGNALNSIRITAQLVQETACRQIWFDRLDRVNHRLSQLVPLQDPQNEQSEQVDLALKALERISNNLRMQNNLVLEHCTEMQEHLTQVNTTLQNQWEHTQRIPMHEPTDLNKLIEDSIEQEFYALKQRKIELEKCLQPIPSLYLERAKLRLAILCLLENAREAIKESRGELGGKITICTSVHQDQVLLELGDNGRGIDNLALSKVCRQGYSTKKSGSGLGLHYAASTMSELRGKLEVSSAGPNQGTTIRLCFPVAAEKKSA